MADAPSDAADEPSGAADAPGDDPAAGPADGEGASPRDPRADDPDRRNLLRWIIAAAIGIPVLVEFRTFLALVGVIDGGDTATPTPTPDVERVGEGDELLPATGPTETVADAVVMARDDGDWLFRLVVEVDNDDAGEYQLRLGTVTTDGGETVAGGASTATLAPGASTTLTAEWDVPPGAAPETVQVSGVVYEDGSATGQTSETVRLADVPVQDG